MSAFNHTPQAFLYGYVQTETPGYRSITIGGTTHTISSTGAGGAVFPVFVSQLNTAISASGWSASLNASGSVSLAGPASAVSFPDSLGLVLGMQSPAGTSLGVVSALVSSAPSPACLPLFGAEWTEIEIKRSVKYEVSRIARTHGYIYGGSRLYRWRLVMNRQALNAMRLGWVLRTRIRVQGSGSGGSGDTSTEIASNNASGYLDGYPLGVQDVSWIDTTQQIARVTLIVAGGEV